MLMLTLMSVAVGSARGQDAIPEGRPDAGAAVFKKCMACHQIGPNAQNGIAPVLNGVVNRPAGQYPNYNYSSANKTSGLVWDERNIVRLSARASQSRTWHEDDLPRSEEGSGNIRCDRLPEAIRCR